MACKRRPVMRAVRLPRCNRQLRVDSAVQADVTVAVPVEAAAAARSVSPLADVLLVDAAVHSVAVLAVRHQAVERLAVRLPYRRQ